jgi:hypothetical protein
LVRLIEIANIAQILLSGNPSFVPKQLSYHKDNGEGFDGFHVGDTRGCGGLELWKNGKLVTSDTYLAAEIPWTGPEVAEFRSIYHGFTRVAFPLPSRKHGPS